MVKIYKATYNDSVDGWGPHKLLGFFVDNESAKEAVKGKSAYGRDGSVEEFLLFDSYDEYFAEINAAKIKRALSKLTPEEKKLLKLE